MVVVEQNPEQLKRVLFDLLDLLEIGDLLEEYLEDARYQRVLIVVLDELLYRAVLLKVGQETSQRLVEVLNSRVAVLADLHRFRQQQIHNFRFIVQKMLQPILMY